MKAGVIAPRPAASILRALFMRSSRFPTFPRALKTLCGLTFFPIGNLPTGRDARSGPEACYTDRRAQTRAHVSVRLHGRRARKRSMKHAEYGTLQLAVKVGWPV